MTFRLRAFDLLATVEAASFFLARADLALRWGLDPALVRLHPPRRYQP